MSKSLWIRKSQKNTTYLSKTIKVTNAGRNLLSICVLLRLNDKEKNMFQGTTPPEVKIVIQDIMDRQKTTCTDVYCACSGNYTTDKMLSAMGFTVHSNDVSLYSKLIADYVLGKDETVVTIKDEKFAKVFANWEETPLKKLCMVMYMMHIANLLPQKNEYQIEMLEIFMMKEQAEKFYRSTIAKLKKGGLDFKIKDFYYGDFADFLKAKKGKGIGIAFPPTYKGGYEKMFKAVEDTFEWKHADYNIFDPKQADELFLSFLKKDRNLIYTDREFDLLSEYETAQIVLGPGKKPVYLYSSIEEHPKGYYVERPQKPQHSKYKTVPMDFVFDENTKINVKVVPKEDVNYFKGFYMSNKVDYTDGGDLALMFFADGMAFGFASFSKYSSRRFGELLGLSDFVVNSNTKRLSKLLIMLELTHDVRMMIARSVQEYYDIIYTPVYTKKPVSMKYRGVFKLEKREPGKLTYCGTFNNSTINETYKKWLKNNKK